MENKQIDGAGGINTNYQDLGEKGPALSKLEKLTKGIAEVSNLASSLPSGDSKLDCAADTKLNAKIEASAAKTQAKINQILANLHADLVELSEKFDRILHSAAAPIKVHGRDTKTHIPPTVAKQHPPSAEMEKFLESQKELHHKAKPRIER